MLYRWYNHRVGGAQYNLRRGRLGLMRDSTCVFGYCVIAHRSSLSLCVSFMNNRINGLTDCNEKWKMLARVAVLRESRTGWSEYMHVEWMWRMEKKKMRKKWIDEEGMRMNIWRLCIMLMARRWFLCGNNWAILFLKEESLQDIWAFYSNLPSQEYQAILI